MYLPRAFAVEDVLKLQDFMEEFNFATVVTQTGGERTASHIPFLLDRGVEPYGVLRAHIAIRNPQRDQWQRPTQILEALNLKPGDTTADLGAGAGYFTLKLPRLVGKSGRVLAIDVRTFPLLFVWIRALRRGQYNVKLIQGEPENSRLPDCVNAVLVVNTYHELIARRKMLDQVLRSLVPGGRLVIVDRGPSEPGPPGAAPEGHELSLSSAEHDVSQAGFEVLQRNEAFVRPPGDSARWMIVARKRGL